MKMNCSGSAQPVPGAAICLMLAEHGASVAINYVSNEVAARQVESEVGTYGVKAMIVQGDQSKEADVASMVAQVVAGLGPIDLLVNNAGVADSADHNGLFFNGCSALDTQSWP